jgi:hypothetical protein
MGESICNLRFSLQALFSRVWEGEWETGLDRFVDARRSLRFCGVLRLFESWELG